MTYRRFLFRSKSGALYPKVIRADWWEVLLGPKPADDFECDSCSCSPDWWRHVPLWPSCRIHDYHYSRLAPLGGTWESRREADRIFRQNLNLLMDLAGVNTLRRAPVVWFYWSRVRLYGSKAYKGWRPSERPADLPWWQRLREVYGFFRPRVDAFDDATQERSVDD